MEEKKELKRVKIRIETPIKTFVIDVTYLVQNWGAPFIIVFMILLIIAAIYLAFGNEVVANKLAEYAYYNLTIGVLLQLVCFIWGERRLRCRRLRRS